MDYCLIFTKNLAPENPPQNWNEGFVGIADNLIYQSASGDYHNWTLVESIDSSQYHAWAIAYGNDKWVVKLADIQSQDPYSGNPLDIYTTQSSDGINWSLPESTGLTANYDYSLGYCSLSNVSRN